MKFRARRLALYLTLMLGSDAIILSASDPGAEALAGLALGLIPGFLMIEWTFAETGFPSRSERALLGLGSGYALLVLGTLLAHYLPGPLPPWPLFALANGLCLLFLSRVVAWLPGRSVGWLLRPIRRPPDHQTTRLMGLIGLLVLAAAFRLPWLGYSEFQGDEAIVMLKAAAVVQGRGDVLFLHKKGPAEILIPTALLALTGRLPEAWARLPFALAGLGGVALIYLLGREVASERAGLWAALLMALNGYLVAFSRIVQYQSLVFFLSGLALWCGYHFWRGGKQAGRYLILAGLFAGVGLLAHYDAVFILPPLGYLVWDRWRRLSAAVNRRRGVLVCLGRRPSSNGSLGLCGRRQDPVLLRATGLTLLLLTTILLSFYLPFVLHPHFQAARSYIGARTGGRPPYLNIRHFWINSTIYNSVYYILLMVTLLLLAVGWHLSCFLTGRGNGLAKANWLWFAGPFLLYTFLLRDPRTHLYIMFPPWALVAGAALDWGLERLRSRCGRAVGYGILVALLLLSAGYLYLVFIQHNPLYQRTYPQHRTALYPTPYGDQFPEMGIFGFPYRAGWKVIGALYQAGILQGDYDSNEEEPITRWYTRGAVRCPHWPRYYFIAWNVQDEVPVPPHILAERYGERAVVEVDGQPRLRIFERDVPPTAEPVIYRLADFANLFDQRAVVEELDTGYPVGGLEAAIAHRRPLTFEGGSIQLLGYSLRGVPVQPGGAFSLLLYWQARGKVPEDYTVFVHLEDGERIWAQRDSPPHCAKRPTSTWEVGEVIIDEHTLVVDPATLPGNYPLRIGLYIPESGRRLHIFTPGGTDLGGAVELERVTVAAPP